MTGTNCDLFTHKSVPVIFEPPCICEDVNSVITLLYCVIWINLGTQNILNSKYKKDEMVLISVVFCRQQGSGTC
jgi:hypothetical protein